MSDQTCWSLFNWCHNVTYQLWIYSERHLCKMEYFSLQFNYETDFCYKKYIKSLIETSIWALPLTSDRKNYVCILQSADHTQAMVPHTFVYPIINTNIYILCNTACNRHILIRNHKSAFGPTLRGIAVSSVRIHKNSPRTVIMTTLIALHSHHDSVLGKAPLYIQQARRWSKCAVAAKSQHCFVLCTTYHRPPAPVKAFSTYAIITNFPMKSLNCNAW